MMNRSIKKGFSSLEILLCVFLVGLITAILFAGLYHIQVHQKKRNLYQTALFMANENLEIVFALSQKETLIPGTYFLDSQDRQWHLKSSFDEKALWRREIEISPFEEGQKVKSTVYWWTYPRQEKSVSLFSLIPRAP